jgi:predicted ribosomally synthesized peptide with nif11-like leader
VVEIAQQAGFTLSVDDIKNGQSALSEEELQGLSGGLSYKQSFCGDCEGQ